MKSRIVVSALVLAVVAGGGCASRVLVPPRFDLSTYYRVGLIEFTMENARGDLNQLATEYFARELFASQSGFEVQELGDMDDVLAETGSERFDRRTAQALGEEYEMPAVFVGELEATPVRPRAQISRFPSLEATVSVELTVRLISTESGATIWSNTADATQSVGGLGLVGREIVFSAEDPEETYGDLVEFLIDELMADFRPSYR